MKFPFKHIAYFITCHGYGHAARACAVIETLIRRFTDVQVEIFTSVPEFFFKESLAGMVSIHPVNVDVGLIQDSPFSEDLFQTLEELNKSYPFDGRLANNLKRKILGINCDLVICDISPIGIYVAGLAKIPSVLIENFTWDWIYESYLDEYPGFLKHVDYLRHVYSGATLRLKTEPLCGPIHGSERVIAPISRSPHVAGEKIRRSLGVPDGEKMVLITMGGIPNEGLMEIVFDITGYTLVIPGGANKLEVKDKVIYLPHHSNYYHPDLMHAADIVIGKAGYSTIAEVYHSGTPYGYILRPNFRESGPLEEFIQRHLPACEITIEEYKEGSWVNKIPFMDGLQRNGHRNTGGDEVVDAIAGMG